MIVVAYCETCRYRHRIDFDPLIPTSAFADWYTRHAQHRVGFLWPERTRKPSWTDRLLAAWDWRRRWARTPEAGFYPVPRCSGPVPAALAAFLANADVKVAYGASVVSNDGSLVTLASLAASSTLLAGRETDAIDNGASNKYLDYLFAGHYRTGASNLQAGSIRTSAVGARNDTPGWPDVFDGTDSVETVSAQGIADVILKLLEEIATDATQRTWPWGKVSLVSRMGLSAPPDQFSLFIAHSAHTSTNVWSATESDHEISYEGVFATVT